MIKKTLTIRNTKRAFTLIELLVSIAIFVVFLGVVSVSYIGIVRSQRQANEVRKMYSDVRTFIESLAEDMRLGTIDYDCYKDGLAPVPAGPVPPSTCDFNAIVDSSDPTRYLAIVNKDQTQRVAYWFDKDHGQLKVKRYQRADTVDTWAEAPGYMAGGNDAGVDPNNGSRTLLSNMVTVKNLTFLVNPPVNPYSSENYDKNQYQFQPKVTLSLTVENADKTVPPFHLDFQTTLSSRVYSRPSL